MSLYLKLDERDAVSIHTYDGIQLYQFRPEQQASLLWSRELRDTSRCELVVPPSDEFSSTHDIVPWAHWLSVWNPDGTELRWTGPIQRSDRTHTALSVSARDVSAFMSRTRVPITKRWDSVDPSIVAGELWDHMIEVQGLGVQTIVRPDPEGQKFDYKVAADEEMIDTKIKDLGGLGFRWTVVSGTPILGPVNKKAIVSLGEADFLENGIGLTVDGSATYNDVILRGGDTLSRARVDLAGLNLQTIVNVNDMFGVSNVDRAVTEYVKESSKIRYSLTLPQGATLHPDAPVGIDQLIPSARFVIEAFGLQFLMELESMEKQSSNGNTSVSVTMDATTLNADEVPELVKAQNKGIA